MKTIPENIADLCTSLQQRCQDAIQSLDAEGLVEIAEILISPRDSEVIELRDFLGQDDK